MALILASFALLSLVLTLWQWLAGMRFPLHQRAKDVSFHPGVTLLKPLKGAEPRTSQCLESWLTQTYPGPTQLLFGIARADDPAAEIVRQLLQKHPQANARLVVCEKSLGANAKVSTLIQLHALAQHEFIVVSDADVLAPPDLLENFLAPMRDPKVGLVNCCYRLSQPSTLGMHWETIAVNVDFWSQVLQGKSLMPLDFAMGAVMATRVDVLAAIGRFESLTDYLADDYQLANRIFRAGKRIELCPLVVDCLSPPATFGQAWSHQLRWARTIRVSKHIPYALSILGNSTLWPLLWLLLAPSLSSAIGFVVCVVIRCVTAFVLERRFTRGNAGAFLWWFVPVKDLLQFAVWACALFGNNIHWRGQYFHLTRDGKLVRLSS